MRKQTRRDTPICSASQKRPMRYGEALKCQNKRAPQSQAITPLQWGSVRVSIRLFIRHRKKRSAFVFSTEIITTSLPGHRKCIESASRKISIVRSTWPGNVWIFDRNALAPMRAIIMEMRTQSQHEQAIFDDSLFFCCYSNIYWRGLSLRFIRIEYWI